MNYLSLIRMNPEVPASELVHLGGLDFYRQHQALWKMFAHYTDERPKFLFRREPDRNGLPIFLVLSNLPPKDTPLWVAQTKEYDPKLKAGDRLAFSVHLNPIISARDPETGKLRKHDIVMHYKHQMREAGEDPNTVDLVQEAVSEWLQNREGRLGCHFNPKSLAAFGYRQQQARKKKYRIQLSTVDVSGILEVTDPDAFRDTLTLGIGSARGLGCGLLLVKRA